MDCADVMRMGPGAAGPEVAAHVAVCPACAELLADGEALARALGRVPAALPGPPGAAAAAAAAAVATAATAKSPAGVAHPQRLPRQLPLPLDPLEAAAAEDVPPLSERTRLETRLTRENGLIPWLRSLPTSVR